MKSLLSILITLFFTSQVFAANGLQTYQVTITNLTKGQPFTPPVVVISNRNFKLYELGKESSPGLKELSTDGKTQTLVEEISHSVNVSANGVGTKLILPGKSDTIEVKGNWNNRLSLVSMLAKTNDAFIGKQGVSLNMKRGHSVTFLAKVYDSGAEINNESKDFIPGLGSPGVNTSESEGFVHFHPGIFGIADLAPVSDAFSIIAAKVTIKRIY